MTTHRPSLPDLALPRRNSLVEIDRGEDDETGQPVVLEHRLADAPKDPVDSIAVQILSQGLDLLDKRAGQTAVALPKMPKLTASTSAASSIRAMFHGPGYRSLRWHRRLDRCRANHGGDAVGQRLVNLLRANHMNVRIDAAGRGNHAFVSDGLNACTDDEVRAYPSMTWVADFSDTGDPAILDSKVGLDDSQYGSIMMTLVIQDQGSVDHSWLREFEAVNMALLAQVAAAGLAAERRYGRR